MSALLRWRAIGEWRTRIIDLQGLNLGSVRSKFYSTDNTAYSQRSYVKKIDLGPTVATLRESELWGSVTWGVTHSTFFGNTFCLSDFCELAHALHWSGRSGCAEGGKVFCSKEIKFSTKVLRIQNHICRDVFNDCERLQKGEKDFVGWSETQIAKICKPNLV